MFNKPPIREARSSTPSGYKWTINTTLTEDEAADLQAEYGFHPSGYGFFRFRVEDGKTTWECSRSSD